MDDPEHLRAKARLCRELAQGARDETTTANLLALADDYEAEADRIEGGPGPEPDPAPRPIE